MSNEHKKKLIFKQGPRDVVISQAWKSWMDHVKQCPACSEMVEQCYTHAHDSKDLFGNAWVIGFSVAMDMVEAGHLQPVQGAGGN